jgi:DNA replication protein DnaC
MKAMNPPQQQKINTQQKAASPPKQPASSAATMGPTPEQLRDRILEALSTLRVPITAEQLDNAIRVAEHRGDSHQAFLWELLGTAAIDRQERAIARRIREARFPNQGALEDFDWSFNASAIDRTQIEQLATGEWMSRTENLVMLGQSGVGKSRLLEGIGRRLCAIGKRVRYTTSGDLLTQLTASLADGTLPRQLSYWSNFDLLIIDEFGLDYVERKLDPQAGHLLFKVIAARNGKSSTAMGTNIEFDAWSAYLGDAPLAMALLDRVVDRAVLLKIIGKSYRASRALRTKPPKSSEPTT